MAFQCKGTCTNYPHKRGAGQGVYSKGYKRCRPCSIYVIWGGHFCPCCGCRLRRNAYSRRYARRLPEGRVD